MNGVFDQQLLTELESRMRSALALPETWFNEATSFSSGEEAPDLIYKENCTMWQNAYACNFERLINRNPDLQAWFERQRSRTFSYEEMVLQCVVALDYADHSRPSIRELWYYLKMLIWEDARMMPQRAPLRVPSYSTFRKRVVDLPRDFVLMTRGRRKACSFAVLALRFQSAIPEVI